MQEFIENLRSILEEHGQAYDLSSLDQELKSELYKNSAAVEALLEGGWLLKKFLGLESAQRTELYEVVMRQFIREFKRFLEKSGQIYDLSSLDEEQKSELYKNSSEVKELLKVGVQLEVLLGLEPAQRSELYENSFSCFAPVVRLLKIGVQLEVLFGLEPEQRSESYKHSYGVVRLLEGGMQLGVLFKLEPAQRSALYNYSGAVEALLKSGVQLEILLGLEPAQRLELYENSSAIACLLDQGMSLDFLLNLGSIARSHLFENCYPVTTDEIKILKINSQMFGHWQKNRNGFFGWLPKEICAEILIYSRSASRISSLVLAKAIIFQGMDNPHPGPRFNAK